MVTPIEQIVKHIEELDKDLMSVFRGSPIELCQVHAALMQAKSTALVALAQAEANEMNRPCIHYEVGVRVKD